MWGHKGSLTATNFENHCPKLVLEAVEAWKLAWLNLTNVFILGKICIICFKWIPCSAFPCSICYLEFMLLNIFLHYPFLFFVIPGCTFYEETFSIRCPKHKVSRTKKSKERIWTAEYSSSTSPCLRTTDMLRAYHIYWLYTCIS